MTLPLENRMNAIAQRLKARTKPDGTARAGFEQNVAQLRAEMELISGRIEIARSQEGRTDAE